MNSDESTGELLNWGVEQLKKHDCPNTDPAREAGVLLSAVVGLTQIQMLAHPEAAMSSRAADKFMSLIRRRRRHEPLAYLLGDAPFAGQSFLVTSDALIPRPATEIILAHILNSVSPSLRHSVTPSLRHSVTSILDVGTGSGCVALTLAAAWPQVKIIAGDISPVALRLARRNARRLGLSGRVEFRLGDLLAPMHPELADGRPVVIFANLPYIPTGDLRKLPPDIRRFEPRLALDGGHDGLNQYRRLLEQLSAWRTGGETQVIFEILPKQARDLTADIKRRWPNAVVQPIKERGITLGLAARLSK